MNICLNCNLKHGDETTCVEAMRAVMLRLLNVLGNQGQCDACQAVIYWVTTKNGKKMPVEPEGISHFAKCEAAAKFRRPVEARA